MANIVCYDSDGSILSHYTQWDVNQKLIIKGADTSSAPDFHFINTLMENAYVVKSNVDNGGLVVNVPDEMLQYDVPIIVHIQYVTGTTEYSVRIPVMPRRMPEDYVFTSSGPGGIIGGRIQIVNDLLTNDPTAALSAAQGVVIKSNLVTLEGSIEERVKSEEMEAAIFEATKNLATSDNVNEAIKNAFDNYESTVEDGATFVPTVDTLGNLSWSNDKNLENPATVNITGPKGDPGDPGPPGEPGRGIVSTIRTSGTGAAGTTDIYTITYTDGSTTTFTVYNGANGKDGSGGSDETGAGGTGENGATFIPYVDSSGNLSWSNDKGLANPDTVNIKGPQGDAGEKGDSGVNGQDGVSATHSWDGTVLSITSASGTSSVDLKGDTGENGYSPVRGVDYWTESDIVEIKSYVDSAILGGEW